MDSDRLLLRSITRAHARFVHEHSGMAFSGLLEDLLELTESEYGFVGEVLTDEAGRPFVKARAITDITWDEASRRLFGENAASGLEFHNLDNLFGAVVLSGKPVISDSPASDPRRGGLPPGHPPLRAFLGLPFHSSGRLVGMVGIANRRQGYDEKLIAFLSPLLSTCASLIEARRNALERDAAEATLRRRLEVDSLVSECVSALVDQPPERLDASIDESLRRMALHMGAERAVLLIRSDDAATLTRTHAWGDPVWGSEGPADYPVADFPWLLPRVLQQGAVLVEDFHALPEGAAAEKEVFIESRISSAAFVAGRDDRSAVALVVLQWWNTAPAHSSDDLAPLTLLVGALAAALRRRRAQDALRESELRFRSLADTAPLMVWIVDEKGRLTFANSEFLRFSGNTLEQQSATSGLDTVHPDDRPAFMAAAAKAFVERVPFELECRARRHDGELRSVLAMGTPRRGTDDGFLGFMGCTVDVTDRRRMEEQLRESHKLEAVGRLAGGIAHDFNNILTAVLGCAECARAELPDGHPAGQDLAEIEEAAQRAAALTDQLLAFARRQVTAPRVVDLNRHVAMVQGLLRRLISESIEVECVAAPGMLPIEIDPGQLEQVLVNLTVNARDAMPRGGRLTIRTAPVGAGGEDGADGAARWVALRVSDTGVGMSDEVLSHVFEPFFTTKEVGSGTGLGLSTCYGIVSQAGGKISARTQLGKGSVFEILFPMADRAPEEDALQADAETHNGPGGETVLLVEDEEGVRRIAARALRSAGYRVLEAQDGTGARSLLLGQPRDAIDLLVTDVVMPRAGGAQVARWVRERSRRVRVLYLSGYADVLRELARSEPESHFLPKPFRPKELVGRVQEILDRSGRESRRWGQRPLTAAPGRRSPSARLPSGSARR